MNFRSDNEAPVHPRILSALADANCGSAPAYGADSFSLQLDEHFSALFETDVIVYPMVSGTAANALCMAQMSPSYGAIFCHRDAHLNVDECGAAEFYSQGAKIMTVSGEHGRIDPSALSETVALLGHKGDHDPLPTVLTLTQATEWGTVYTPEQVRTLCDLAHDHQMLTHMDGARLANALASTGHSPAEMTHRSGIDVLSLGLTKNGAMAAEAVVFFRPELAEQFGRRRMKGGHLLSKMRYVSAQLLRATSEDLWLDLAHSANTAARRLGQSLTTLEPHCRLVAPIEANELFVQMSDELHRHLNASGCQYHRWPGTTDLYRWVAAWDVSEESLLRVEQACRDFAPQ